MGIFDDCATAGSGGRAAVKDDAAKPGAAKQDGYDWRKMWGKQPEAKVEQPGQATIEREKVRNEQQPSTSQTETSDSTVS